jgi:hypothetical protein
MKMDREAMIESVLQSHLNRYPEMKIQDLYKLLHQAALGSEHAFLDPESARDWLTRELAEMSDGPRESLIDPISLDGGIVRIHLRPFVTAGYDADELLESFIRTAREYQGNARLLEEYWRAAVKTAYFAVGTMDKFIQTMKKQNYPPVHHSAEYERIYRPAYRVVAQEFCPATWLAR